MSHSRLFPELNDEKHCIIFIRISVFTFDQRHFHVLFKYVLITFQNVLILSKWKSLCCYIAYWTSGYHLFLLYSDLYLENSFVTFIQCIFIGNIF